MAGNSNAENESGSAGIGPSSSDGRHEKSEKSDGSQREAGSEKNERPQLTERATHVTKDSIQSDNVGTTEHRDRRGARATESGSTGLVDQLKDGARNFVCRSIFDSKFKPKDEPKEAEPERGFVERTVDWLGLDSFRSDRSIDGAGSFFGDAINTYRDFNNFHAELLAQSEKGGKVVDVPGLDKHFHCMANCVGNSRGTGGEVASAALSSAKEAHDVLKSMICRDWSYGAATRDSMKDQLANRIGRDAGRAGLRCADACSSDRFFFEKSLRR